ncbi:hypothetical protein M9H77_26689 [Catharanthus roseus]|uniref:Uncharacterized protein n=1 Tax=Catharanthus roseus TaxID=4058 RepID=A0ACC0AAV4_CATRO|nr:hypothetical protein M9H77_26689 [Catharanthus roseus]
MERMCGFQSQTPHYKNSWPGSQDVFDNLNGASDLASTSQTPRPVNSQANKAAVSNLEELVVLLGNPVADNEDHPAGHNSLSSKLVKILAPDLHLGLKFGENQVNGRISILHCTWLIPCTRVSSDVVDGFLTLRVDPLVEGHST